MAPTEICKVVNTIDAPIDRVWEVVSVYGGIDKWMPNIDKIDVEGEGVGAIRTIYAGPVTIKESLESFDPESHSFSYKVLSIPGMPIRGNVSLTAADDKTTTMTYWYDIDTPIDEPVRQGIAAQSTGVINASVAKLKGVVA